MRSLKTIFYVCLGTLLIACSTHTSQNLNSVSLGMTKKEAIEIMGQPASVSAKKNTEYLLYKLSSDAFFDGPIYQKDYYVRLVNGRVDSYGKVGDFKTKGAERIEITVKK